MKKLLLTTTIFFFSLHHTNAQGCSPIRHPSGVSAYILFKDHKSFNKYILNFTNRYFEASNTYRGNKYITDTLVTNKIYSLNISLSRIFNHGWSMALSMPVSANSRRNYADHGGLQNS